MTDPVFGLSINREDAEPRAPAGADMSVAGLIGTAPLADAQAFPYDTPVFLYSNDAAKLLALGATGTLPDALTAINDQLGELQVAARVVVVRVQDDAEADDVITAIVGDAGAKTGLYAFKEAPSLLGVTPRLIGAPGYTHQTKVGVLNIDLTDPGADGTDGTFALAFTGGGGGAGAAGTFTVAGGVVTEVVITSPGHGYTAPPAVSFVASAGLDGATAAAAIGLVANPVCAALPPILAALLAHAPVAGPSTSRQAAIDWRETLSSDRLIPTDGGVKVGVNATARSDVGRIIGIAIRRDHEKGGVPSGSWANQPVRGIVAPGRNIAFSLTDGSVEGQELLANNIGVIVRGEAGVDTAIAAGGFVFIGTDNAGADDLWRFYNVTRMRDFIHLTFIRTLRIYLGRFNLTGQTVQAVMNTMKLFLRGLQADGHILGFQVEFRPDQNSPENLRLGRVSIRFAGEETPVLRHINLRSARYRPALDELIESLAGQLAA